MTILDIQKLNGFIASRPALQQMLKKKKKSFSQKKNYTRWESEGTQRIKEHGTT